MNGEEKEVRCMLIPARHGRLLLPSASVAEVIGYRPPDQREDRPAWLQGTVVWRQRELPVIDFEQMTSVGETAEGIRQRIVICYATGNDPVYPLIGFVAQGIPRLMRVSAQTIHVASGGAAGSGAVRMTLSIAGESLAVPDLDYVQAQLAAA